MVVVEAWIAKEMGITPTSVGLMVLYNVVWTYGAVIIGEVFFAPHTPTTDLTYVGGGLYRDGDGNYWADK